MFRAIKQYVTGTCLDQKSLSDYNPKRIRIYNGTHVNIASYYTDSYMAETEL